MAAPTAITQAATNIGSTIARINGKISDDGGATCEARFRWRPKDEALWLLDTWEYSAYGKVYCVYTYGSYLYVIAGTSPPTVLKIDISDGTLSDYWVATNVLYKGLSLFVMGSYLYVGGADSSDILRGKLVQLNLSTMEYVDSLLAPDSNDANWVTGITGDDSYIYFCLETLTTAEAGEYIVGKADPTDMSLTDSYDVQELPIGNNCGNCHEICISGSYIYTANFTGHILKLAKSDMSLSTYYYDSSKQFLNITTNGTYVYAGGKEGLPPPGKYIIDKFAISDLSLSVEWDAGYTYIYSLAYSDSKLYAASKKYCYVLDPSDMSLDTQWESANDDWSYLSVIDKNVYFGQDFSPATIYVLQFGWAITSWQNTLETDATYYEDLTDLATDTEYEFQTQAKNSAGEGEWSASAYFETEAGQHYNRSGTASLGLVGAGTRPIGCVRSNTGLLGLLATATRSWALGREDTALLGLKATASRILTPVRAQTALLGLKATASQAVNYSAKTGTALLGLVATGSRAIALSRSKTVLLGLKATGVMTTLGHYTKEVVVYLGLAVTGTRPIVLARADTALLGLKATATKAITLTRADTALLGLKTTGILIIPYIRTGTAYLGLKVTASRSFALTRLNTALLGLKAVATRSLVLSRAKTALLGLKVTGKFPFMGRALRLVIITTQNRKLNVITSLYRKIRIFTE